MTENQTPGDPSGNRGPGRQDPWQQQSAQPGNNPDHQDGEGMGASNPAAANEAAGSEA